MTHNDFVQLLTLRLVGLGVDINTYLNHPSYTIRNLLREEGWCANIPRNETRRDFLDILTETHGDHFADIHATLRDITGKVSDKIHCRSGHSNEDIQAFISAVELALWDARIKRSEFLTAAGCGVSTYRSILVGKSGIGHPILKRLKAGLEKLNITIQLPSTNSVMAVQVEQDVHHRATELKVRIGRLFRQYRKDSMLALDVITSQTGLQRRYINWVERGLFNVVDDRYYKLLGMYPITAEQKQEIEALTRQYKVALLKIYAIEGRRICAQHMRVEFLEYVSLIRHAFKNRDWRDYFSRPNRILVGEVNVGVNMNTLIRINGVLRNHALMPKHSNIFLTV